MRDDLVTRLQTEADQCRNDGADDIARLLDEAAAELRSQLLNLAEARQARDDGWAEAHKYAQLAAKLEIRMAARDVATDIAKQMYTYLWASLPELGDGFDSWWSVTRINRVLNPAGFARAAWRASAKHNRRLLLAGTPRHEGGGGGAADSWPENTQAAKTSPTPTGGEGRGVEVSGLAAEGSQGAGASAQPLREGKVDSSGLTAEGFESSATTATPGEQLDDAPVPEPADWQFARMLQHLGRNPA